MSTPVSVQTILQGAIAPRTGEAIRGVGTYRSFQAILTGAGAITADVDIEVSNDGSHWLVTEAGTIELSGTDEVSDGFIINAPWAYVRGKVNSISGTQAAVDILMGEI